MAVVHLFSVWDYVVYGATLLVSLCIGIYYAIRGKQKTNKDFLLAGKDMSVIPVALSLLASYQSAILMLGLPAEVFDNGIQIVWATVGASIALFLAAIFFLPPLYRLQLTSVNQYLEMRFESKIIRILGCFIFMLQMLLYMAVVLFSPSLALSAVTDLPKWVSIVLVGVLCTIYTSIGGLKAVIWTDTLQALLMFAGMIMIIVVGTLDVGGVWEVMKINMDHGRLNFFDWRFDPTVRHAWMNVVFGAIFLWLNTYGCHQAQIQRYSSMPSLKRAMCALLLNIPGFAAMSLLAAWGGLVMVAVYLNCDPLMTGAIERRDQIAPYFVMEKLGHLHGLPGLYVAALFSGAMSTISSGTNSISALVWEDLLHSFNYFKNIKEENKTRITQCVAFLFGFGCIGLSFFVGSVDMLLPLSLSLNGIVAGPLLALFTLGLLLPCVNKWGAGVGVVVGTSIASWVFAGAILQPSSLVPLPTFTSHCDVVTNITNTVTNNTAEALTSDDDSSLLNNFYSMSYMLYPVLGWIVTVVTALLVSSVTGCNRNRTIEPELLHPITRCLCCQNRSGGVDFREKELEFYSKTRRHLQ